MNIFEKVFEGYDTEKGPCSEHGVGDFKDWESQWWPTVVAESGRE